ncbi:MAG: TRAP transporter permease [Azospirillaceae bacterium]
MTDQTSGRALTDEELQDLVASTDTGGRQPDSRFVAQLILWTAFGWSLFQVWYASPLPFMTGLLIVNDAEARALHLGFALFLGFMAYPAFNPSSNGRPAIGSIIFAAIPVILGFAMASRADGVLVHIFFIVMTAGMGWLIVTGTARKYVPLPDWAFALVGVLCATYRFWFYDDLVDRSGRPLLIDIYASTLGIIILLEATRRSLGPALTCVAGVALFYVFFGDADFLPDVLRYQGASLNRAMEHFWLSDQGVFGIAVGVSTRFVFLFVLFGALLDRGGAGNYFIKVAFALLGHLRGGPAKAAVVASGMTGLISGSSIANVVTTGTFTVPLMKRVGFSSEKAGAVEVASSVNGQIMPPVMGAAAFLMVEYVGIPYVEVIQHAFLPAIISYIALVYIVHLEALKSGMQALPKPGERIEPKWAMISFGITLCSILILCGIVYYVFQLASLFSQNGLALLAVLLMGAGQIVFFRALGARLPRDRVRRTISVGALVLANVVLGAFALYFGMAFLKDVFGDDAAAWIGAAAMVAAYVGLVAFACRFPELELDDPNAPVIALPEVGPTVKTGLYYLLPIVVLIWNLMIERLSPGLSAFWASVFMIFILVTQKPLKILFRDNGRSTPELMLFGVEALANFVSLVVNNLIVVAAAIAAIAFLQLADLGALDPVIRVGLQIAVCVGAFLIFLLRERFRLGLLGYRRSEPMFHDAGKEGVTDLFEAMIAGARNMIGIGIATAAAGIIVGTVTLTGIGNVLAIFVEQVSGGSLIIMLVLVAILSLILGMGLPTTANYIVVSALMAPVIVEVGASNGLVVPLIAVHLFVFYFGIMADVTPPVGLASFAAAAVSGGDPIRTGFTAFYYSLRTIALPFMFIFNTQLILYDLSGPFDIALTVVSAVIAMLVFAAATQGYFFARSRIWESLALLLVAFTLFRPGYWMDMIYPPTETAEGQAAVDYIAELEPGTDLRIVSGGDSPEGFVTRTVELTLPEGETAEDRLFAMGFEDLSIGEGTIEFLFIGFDSPAERAGLDLPSGVTWTTIERIVVPLDTPPKELMWIPTLLVLGGIIVLQRRRQALEPTSETASQPAQ